MNDTDKELLRVFLEDLMVDDVTNQDEPFPTIWLTGNTTLDKLNHLRKLVGLDAVNVKG